MWGCYFQAFHMSVKEVLMCVCCHLFRGNAGKLSGLLSSEEGVTLICGIIFFVAFFVAAFVEIRVERSIYRLICDLLTHNVDWHIDDYDRAADVRRPVTSASISMRECQTAV